MLVDRRHRVCKVLLKIRKRGLGLGFLVGRNGIGVEQGANRLVQVLFKFVPLRTGVDELTTGGFTQMLGFGVALGTTLAIVRKIRTIAWVLVGTSLLIRRTLRRG